MPRLPRSTNPLCRYVDPLIGQLRRRVPVALKEWDAKAIHDSRVATRRLRAALDLLTPVAPDKLLRPLRKASRRMRRRLGSLRDFDVMIDALDTVASHRPQYAIACGWVREQLHTSRNKARRKLKRSKAADLLDRLNAWTALRAQALQLSGVIDGLMIASLRSQWDAFASKAEARSTNLFDSSCDDDAIPNPHELRIAGKLLRYTFEMLDESGHVLPPMVAKTFKRMQKALGDWHDCVVLAEQAMRLSLDRQLARCDPLMQERALALTGFVLRRGKRALRRFAAQWRENGRALSQVVEEIVSGRETDRRPSDSGGTTNPAQAPPDASSAA